jgi:predicted dehydrogenase
MPDHLKPTVWLVGTGPIGIEYAKVLKAQKISFIAIGKDIKAVNQFRQITSHEALSGGLEHFLKGKPVLSGAAIAAVNIEALPDVAIQLLQYGVKKILIEKPAGIQIENIREISRVTDRFRAQVYVAYNRRFFASVLAAQTIIKKDGGVTSFSFEFTEHLDQIRDFQLSPSVKKNWMIANSHPIDLAFFLGGRPKIIYAFQKKGCSWPYSAIFSGAGISDRGALFSYNANWESPGRWGVEILTGKHRLIFKPLEKLQVQNLESNSVDFIKIDDSLDRKFKPGFYRQVQAWMKKPESLLTIKNHLENFKIYEKIKGKN